MSEFFDKIIIGAGLYGLFAAAFCAERGQSVLVFECDAAPFSRATFSNQARVHQGYHYPRSLSTAKKSAKYFSRFNEEFDFCINRSFKKIYATSKNFSWTNAQQFASFCEAAKIPFEELEWKNYFKSGMCDGAFLCREYTYDAKILCDYFLKKISAQKKTKIFFGAKVNSIKKENGEFQISVFSKKEGEKIFSTSFLLNATYASTNQISKMAGFEPFKIKYELCEIILCRANKALSGLGFTVMDGPFFSIMPFGKTTLHSLTSVTFTPHATSFEDAPVFDCQKNAFGICSSFHLANCNECAAKPKTAFPYMAGLAKKYLRDEYDFEYERSLFSVKPILKSSEIDDSRPTVIKTFCKSPTFVSVLSGKINTVYDLEEVLA